MKECRRLQNKKEFKNSSEMVVTLDSREVAEMLGKQHNDLMKNIRNYISYLAEGEITHRDYFIESTYLDANNQERPCYLLTKMGCEMVANKMTGSKGVIFTAKYVKRFNEMEQGVTVKQLSPLEQLRLQYEVIEEHEQNIKEIKGNLNNLENNMPLFNIECKELQGLVRKVGTKVLGGYKSPAYQDNSLRAKIYKDIQGQLKREFGVDKYEAIKRIQLEKAREIVSNYTVPVILQDQIILLNNQMRITEVI